VKVTKSESSPGASSLGVPPAASDPLDVVAVEANQEETEPGVVKKFEDDQDFSNEAEVSKYFGIQSDNNPVRSIFCVKV
jgi:hypothetical protein